MRQEKKMARETMEQTLMTKDSFYFSLSKIRTKSIHPILPTARGNIKILMILDEGKKKEKFFVTYFWQQFDTVVSFVVLKRKRRHVVRTII